MHCDTFLSEDLASISAWFDRRDELGGLWLACSESLYTLHNQRII